MNIEISWGASVASAPAGFEAAVEAAADFVDAAFASTITVSLTFDYSPLAGSDVGASDTEISTYSYSSVVAALTAAAVNDSALASEVLPSVDPFGDDTLTLATADARQLGLTSLPPSSDGTVTLSSSVGWNWNASVGSVSADFNAVTTLIHEITETLGRIAGSDGDLLTTPLALFRYSAPGVIDTSNKAGGYLSLNGGVTDLVAMGNTGGDLADYDVNVDPFGYAVAGAADSVTEVDLDAMEAIGYGLSSNVHFGGGAVITLSLANQSPVILFNSDGDWDTLNGEPSGEVQLWNDQASVIGGNVTVLFYAGSATSPDAVSLYSATGLGDSVVGSDGIVTVVNSSATISGGSNQVYADRTSSVTLKTTDDAWDAVTASNSSLILAHAQASVSGGNDYIQNDAAMPGSDAVSLYATDNNWDLVDFDDGVVTLTSAQAAIDGYSDTIYFNGSGSNAVSLFYTGPWDTIYGSNGVIILNSAQSSVMGGGDTIYFNPNNLGYPTDDAVSLYDTDGSWDTVWGSTGTVILSSAQASVFGGGDTIYLDGSTQDAVSLYATSGAWDTVYGSNGAVSLVSAQASVIGGGDYLYLSGTGSAVSLYSTAGPSDTVSGPGSVTLNNAQANLASGGETIYLNGTADVLSFAAHYGQDVISGFVATDTLKFSATDWSSFAALQASGDIVSSGSNTLIKLDANDVLTLLGVSASSLTAANA